MRRRILALVLLCVAGPATTGVLDGAQPAKRRSPAPTRASTVQKCEDCRSAQRRRVAVMPVALEIAPEIQESRSGLAQGIERRLRELLSGHENLRAVETAEMGLASEAARGDDARGRAPIRYSRRTPAQAEVFLTVTGLRVAAEGRREASQAAEKAAGEAVEPENRRVQARVTIEWRLVDSRWGVLLTSGSSEGAAAREEKGPSGDAVDEAVAEALRKIADQASRAMNGVPPRVKVVEIGPRFVAINAGSSLGVAVGDTFGLIGRVMVMTDPDTGLPLEAPPAPAGKFRTAQVAESFSMLEAIERAGPIERGDELEWIGVYAPRSTSTAPTEAPARTPAADFCGPLLTLGRLTKNALDEQRLANDEFLRAIQRDAGSALPNPHHLNCLAVLKKIEEDASSGRFLAIPRSIRAPILLAAASFRSDWDRMIAAEYRGTIDPGAAVEAVERTMTSLRVLTKAFADTAPEALRACPDYRKYTQAAR